MAYGILKVDTITFTDGGVDKSVPVSGLVQNPTFTGNVTVTGTISGNIIQGGTTVSGVTITGTTVSTTTGNFTSLTGTTATITSGIIASGTAALPSLAILSDPNTGIYSPGADQLAVATNGTEKLIVLSNGNVGIGNSSPAQLLHLSSTGFPTIRVTDADNSTYFDITNSDGDIILKADEGNTFASSAIRFMIDGGEKFRCDSSGRLLVGTSTADSTYMLAGGALTPAVQFKSATVGLSVNRTDDGAVVFLANSNNVSTADREYGRISFNGNNGSGDLKSGAWIQAFADAATGTNDMPGRLVFSTTADGASSPTEAMRIRATGTIEMGKADSGEKLAVLTSGTSTAAIGAYATNGSYGSSAIFANVNRAANSAYNFFSGYSSDFTDLEFRLYGDGNGKCDGSWTGGGADYAEYFEWSDNNPDAEDRRGISVVLDGDKIREAVAGEDPIGVISGNPSVVGDAAWNKWSGKYLRDEFGTYIQEDYEVEDEDGNTVVQQRRKLNPAYDPDVEYISREQRPEWDCVGLMGKLRIRKGQVTDSRWIKMRDISDSVEEWLVR